MTTHSVNQELAKHHYATLMREASSHRLAKETKDVSESERPSYVEQITWALRSFVRRLRGLRPAVGSV